MAGGIAILGMNGAGKSTLAHALAEATGRFCIDAEDYYFPTQRQSRLAALEGVETAEQSGELPFSAPVSKDEVERAILEDMTAHPGFIFAGVTMSWGGEITSKIDAVFVVKAPLATRLERIESREVRRWGRRVLPGGDMYQSQRQFREGVAAREQDAPEKSIAGLDCPVYTLDGTLPVEENVKIVMGIIG